DGRTAVGSGGGGGRRRQPRSSRLAGRGGAHAVRGQIPLHLYNPAWPVRARATGLAPAKVVADPAGRAGQALNSLVCEGSMICGGVVVSSVLGHAVLVESGAEVEDSVLLEGCRIGRGALVRRALVGPGAVVADGQMIGYGAAPSAPGRLAPSGLTVVVAPTR